MRITDHPTARAKDERSNHAGNSNIRVDGTAVIVALDSVCALREHARVRLPALERQRRNVERLCPAIGGHGGTLVIVTREVLVAVFENTVSATRYAVAMNRHFSMGADVRRQRWDKPGARLGSCGLRSAASERFDLHRLSPNPFLRTLQVVFVGWPVLAGWTGGCGTIGTTAETDTYLFADPVPLDNSRNQEDESVESTQALTLIAGLEYSFGGTIAAPGDVDILDLGRMDAGDELVVDVFGIDGLDPVAAILDSKFNLVYINDDRSVFAEVFDAGMSLTIRHGDSPYYLMVASSPKSDTAGEYNVQVTWTPKVKTLQAVLLNFEGAWDVAISNRTPVDVPAFRASSISPTLAGRTDELVATVLDHVRRDFAGLNVLIVADSEDIPTDQVYSTIHFGLHGDDLLGIAQNVDEFNKQPVQEAIVFTESFKMFNRLNPSFDEYAQALANVTSHEIGHLFGLVHTADVMGIMDTTASAVQVLHDKSFSLSPLGRTVAPMGFQDSPAMLVENVGGVLAIVRENAPARVSNGKVARPDGHDWLPARNRGMLSTCSCQ